MTNTVNYETGVQVNADGLRVKYGVAEALRGVAGTVANKDDERVLYVTLDASRMLAFTKGMIYGSEPECAIPTGAIVTAASLETTAAWTGTGCTIDIGLVDRDGKDVSLDTGFWSALAITGFSTVGTVQTSSGAIIGGVALLQPSYLWVKANTATATAGTARLKIVYNMPRSV